MNAEDEMDEKVWLRHLMPLPHEISIGDRIECRPQDVSIVIRPDAGDIERRAAAELERLFGMEADGEPTGRFAIEIGVADDETGEDIDRLKALPNCEQAYLIRPEGRERLRLTALSGSGIFYAVTTLIQLIEPALTEDRVILPLVHVTDWPDMDERGMWNFPDPETWVPWMASLKLNYGKMASTKLGTIAKGQRNSARIDAELMREGRLRAFNYLPYILHLNFLHDYGLFRTYPELAGKGDEAITGRYAAHKQGNQHRVPCASNPILIDILTEWMMDIALQGADEVSCWLSERPGQCGCTTCTAEGQFVLESRAFVAAWHRMRKQHPDFQIRIFLSTTTLERDYRVLAELPSEVKIERACATELERVCHMPRDLAANPLFDQYAGEGRWIASYDVPIGANGRVDTPEFKAPHCSAHRIRDYVGQLIRRRYSGAYGMMAWATQGREICGFNLHALAEWSWNMNGRTEREFAVAWAIRERYENPEAVGEWAELMGPVEFDVYDSDFPICYSWGKAVDMVRGRRRPYLGEGMFRYYADAGDFGRKRAVCERALQIAEGFKDAHLANETRVVLTYVRLAECIYRVAEPLATLDLADLDIQEVLRTAVQDLEGAGAENVSAIRTWRGVLGPEPWHARVYDALKATETTVEQISRFVSERYLY